MSSLYPASLDALSTSHSDSNNEVIHAATINDLADAVNKLEAELGVNFSGRSLPVYNVMGKPFNAVGNGVADDSAAILAAKAAAVAAGSGIVFFPARTFAHTASLTVQDADNVFFLGVGGGSSVYQFANYKGSVLKYTGSAGATQVKWGATSGAAAGSRGGGISGITLDGNDLAAKGLEILSHWWGDFRNLHICGCTDVGLDLNIVQPLSDGVEDCQSNSFENIGIQAQGNCIGARLDGGAAAGIGNTSVNNFRNLLIYHANGVGLQLGDADTNTFVGTLINRTGNGISLELKGSASAGIGYARHNWFFNLQSIGGVTSRGTALAQPAGPNFIFYDLGNSSPEPVVEAGSDLRWIDSSGYLRNMRLKNNAPLKGRNAADTVDLDIISINTLNEASITQSLRLLGGLVISNATDVTLSTSTGSKIGTATTQKLGFWNATPVVQPAANANTSGATLAALETEVNELKALLRTVGLMAP